MKNDFLMIRIYDDTTTGGCLMPGGYPLIRIVKRRSFTMTAIEITTAITLAIEKQSEFIKTVMEKPNHTNELSDVLTMEIIEQAYARDYFLFPWCGGEADKCGLSNYTYGETARRLYRDNTKITLACNERYRTLNYIMSHPDIIGTTGDGLIASTPDSLDYIYNNYTDCDIVEIHLAKDASYRVYFNVMKRFNLAPDELEDVHVHPDDVLWETEEMVRSFCVAMSPKTWKLFDQKWFEAWTKDKVGIGSKVGKIALVKI